MEHSIKWVGTPNFEKGRRGRTPIAICNHITAGRYPGCLSWMQNPEAEASAHYLITMAGEILQLVKDEDMAWANGRANKPSWPLYDGTNPNLYTLSIEHEAMGGEGLTEEQYQATLWLHAQLVKRWGTPIDRDHIIGHYQIDSVNRPNCPGPKFPWDRLIADLRAMTSKPRIVIGGQVLDALLVDGRTYAPVRALAEALGRYVEWVEAEQTVYIR